MSPGHRERAVLEALAALPKENAVLVGGYAVNAYVPPRFSVDCDLVVLAKPDAIESKLVALGYSREERGDAPSGRYTRYVKGIGKDKVSFDLLVDAVEDRQTGVVFRKPLFEKHSAERTTTGRLHPARIRLRIADPELLFVMKFVAGRAADVRDAFMLAGEGLDRAVVQELVKGHCPRELVEKRAGAIRETVSGRTYRDALQGPYGVIPERSFERCKGRLLALLDDLASG